MFVCGVCVLCDDCAMRLCLCVGVMLLWCLCDVCVPCVMCGCDVGRCVCYVYDMWGECVM